MVDDQTVNGDGIAEKRAKPGIGCGRQIVVIILGEPVGEGHVEAELVEDIGVAIGFEQLLLVWAEASGATGSLVPV